MDIHKRQGISFSDMVSDELVTRENCKVEDEPATFRQWQSKRRLSQDVRSVTRGYGSLGDSFLSTFDGGYSDSETSNCEHEAEGRDASTLQALDQKFSMYVSQPISDKWHGHQQRNREKLQGNIRRKNERSRSLVNDRFIADQEKTSNNIPQYCPYDSTQRLNTSRMFYSSTAVQKNVESPEQIKIKELIKENVLLTREIERLKAQVETSQREDEEHKTTLLAVMTEKHERRVQHVKEELDLQLVEEKQRRLRVEQAIEKAERVYTEKIEQLETRLEELLASLRIAEESKTTEEKRSSELKKQTDTLQEQVTATLYTVTQFSEKHVSLTREIESLQQVISEKDHVISANEVVTDGLKKEIESLKADIATKAKYCEETCWDVRHYAEALCHTETALKEEKENNARLHLKLETKQTLLVSEEKRSQAMIHQIKELEKEIEKIMRENNVVLAQSAQYRDIAQNSWDEAQSLDKEIKILRHRISQQNEILRQLKHMTLHSSWGTRGPESLNLIASSSYNSAPPSPYENQLNHKKLPLDNSVESKEKVIKDRSLQLIQDICKGKNTIMTKTFKQPPSMLIAQHDELPPASVELPSNPLPLPPHAVQWLRLKGTKGEKPLKIRNILMTTKSCEKDQDTARESAMKKYNITSRLQTHNKPPTVNQDRTLKSEKKSNAKIAVPESSHRPEITVSTRSTSRCSSLPSLLSNKCFNRKRKERLCYADELKPEPNVEQDQPSLIFLKESRSSISHEALSAHNKADHFPRLSLSPREKSAPTQGSDLASVECSEELWHSSLPCSNRRASSEEDSIIEEEKINDSFSIESIPSQSFSDSSKCRDTYYESAKGTLLHPPPTTKPRPVVRLVKIQTSKGHCRYELRTVSN